MKFSQIIENDEKEVKELDSLIDAQKRLLFTETRMKAINEPTLQHQIIEENDD